MVDNEATMGGDVQGPVYTDPGPPQADLRAINGATMAAAARTIENAHAQNPNLGYGLEKLIMDYPTISRDMAVGLAMSGQIGVIPEALLDELAMRDRLQQEAASDNALFSGLKTGIRQSIVGMEDLYNMSPLMALPRYAINRHQHMSHDDAYEAATQSVAGTHLELKLRGIKTDYGSGYLPSEELVPGDDGYFDLIKRMIEEGTFEGSPPEEQLLAASNEAMIQQAVNIGMNPWAITREQWLSTTISRTVNGVNQEVPYSPGAALAINVTTPGTRAYALTSGMGDAFFRMTMEPVDIVFDNVGDAILHSINPRVTGDVMSFINKGSEQLHQVLKDVYNVDVALEPIIMGRRGVEGAADTAGKRAKAVTGPEVSPDGTAKTTIDVEQTSRAWYHRINDIDAGNNKWVDITDPYQKAYADRGLGPDDVRDILGQKGGVEAENMLTLEHELVHSVEQVRLYDIVPDENGNRLIDTGKLSDEAPEEMQVIAKEINDRNLDYETIAAQGEKVKNYEELLDIAQKDVVRVKDELHAGVKDSKVRTALEKELKQNITDVANLEKRLAGFIDEAEEAVKARRTLNAKMSEITELDAINKAWDNMMDGSWKGPELLKKVRRKMGLTNRLRPWVNPKTVGEWLRSAQGERTLEYLLRTTDFESLRRVLPYLDEQDIKRISNLVGDTDKGKISTILQDAFNAPSNAGLKQPTIGKFKDTMAKGLDGWESSTEFMGGTVARASKSMGRVARRGRVSVGNNVLSTTNLPETLDAINSALSTVGVERNLISDLQKLAVDIAGTKTGLDRIFEEIERLSKERLKSMGSKVYTDAEVDQIWAQWRGYEMENVHYWVSNAGNDRRWLFENKKFKNLTEAEEAGHKGEAFMEAQFASTHRVLPDIRRFRRLHSRQRNAYERVMQWKNRRGQTPETFQPHRKVSDSDIIIVDGVRYTPEELNQARTAAWGDMGPEKPPPRTDEEAVARGFDSKQDYDETYERWSSGELSSEEFSRIGGYTDEEIEAMSRHNALDNGEQQYDYLKRGEHSDATDPEYLAAKPHVRPDDPEVIIEPKGTVREGPEAIGHKGGWEPTGFDSTRIMHAGDASFGLWRDMNLLRLGWAMRVIPEEQLRFGATGYSGLFTNPIDYFISMLNRMDFTINGDELTLGEIMKHQESLGTAGLRDPAMPIHQIPNEGWDVAFKATHPVQYWRGLTREFITMSSDEIVSMVARDGGVATLAHLRTPEGRKIVKRIAADAAQENTLAKIANDKELVKLIDIYELRIAQMTGGDGLWHNPVTSADGKRYWVDVNDVRRYKATDTEHFNNIDALLTEVRKEVAAKGGDPDDVLKGKSKIKRAEAEDLLNEVRGYDLDKLEADGHAAVIIREGNEEMRGLIGNKQLDDIKIRDEMPLHELKQMDQQLQRAYEARPEVVGPDAWAVPKGDLNPEAPSWYSKVTDKMFEGLNGVPSKVLNRSPFFQQSFGAKIAEAYFYGDSGLRSSIDEFVASNRSFKVTFDLGKRKVFKDMGVNKFPKPFDAAKRMDPPAQVEFNAQAAYEDALEMGQYDRIPLVNDPDSHFTLQFFDIFENQNYVENQASGAKGIWSNRRNRQDKTYTQYENHGFLGSERIPLAQFVDRSGTPFIGPNQIQKQLEPMGWAHSGDSENIYGVRDFVEAAQAVDTPVTTEALVAHGVKEDLARLLSGEEKALHHDEVRIVEDLLQRKFLADLPADEQAEMARKLGWKDESIRTTGVANSPMRAWTYPSGADDSTYVDIVYTPHMDPDLQRHLIEEGDIEQLFTLDVRYPTPLRGG